MVPVLLSLASTSAAWIAQPAPKPAPPQLDYRNEQFAILRDGKTVRVPLKRTAPAPKKAVLYRSENTFAVWDERGLTTRTGQRVLSSRLKEIATTPKIFTKEQILETTEKARAGTRSLEATSLSGSLRVGPYVYFMPRWEDRDGTPWLEALVRVDLREDRPKAQFLGRFEGLSLSREPLGEEIFGYQGKLYAVTRQPEGAWGRSAYDPASGTFSFAPVGHRLEGYIRVSPAVGIYRERTTYGPMRVGRHYLQRRKDLFETHALIKGIDADTYGPEGAILVSLSENGKALLRNAETGAEMALPASSAYRASSAGVVVWAPWDRPRAAWLYDPARWEVLARWRAPSP